MKFEISLIVRKGASQNVKNTESGFKQCYNDYGFKILNVLI